MEINLNNAIQSANPTSSNNAAGISAPQTDAQRADVAATRAVSNKESANLEDRASSSEERRFEAVRTKAAKFVGGENPFLQDYKFTIYGSSQAAGAVNEYVIRFTDLKTGAIETKSEADLFAGTGGGALLSGQV